VDLLTACLRSDKYQFLPKLGEVCAMLAKAAQDANPEMKGMAARLAGELCDALREKTGPYMKATAASLVKNLQHQHSKVRKASLLGLRNVLCCRGAEPFLEDAVLQLKFAMNDRSLEVRQVFYSEVVHHWINNMEINSLKAFDPTFVLFMLNGVADESQDIAEKCAQMLEEHGTNMREALVKLGEEEDMVTQ